MKGKAISAEVFCGSVGVSVSRKCFAEEFGASVSGGEKGVLAEVFRGSVWRKCSAEVTAEVFLIIPRP